MWVSSAAAASHMAHIRPLFLSTSSIFLGELFLQPCGDPNQGKDVVEKALSFYYISFQSDDFARTVHWVVVQLRGQVEMALEKNQSISCGLLNLASISFCFNG